jgi:hypothetical protein
LAGKIIADIIEAPFDSIKMNVANVTVLTANNSGLTYLPTGNVNINIGSTASLTLGNVTVSNLITANGGIKFPATQVASADVNTLDDYEEGTWTPGLEFGSASAGMTFLLQTGRYVKIGRAVYAGFSLELSNKGSSTGASRITGLPFTVGNSPESRWGGSCSYYDNLTSAGVVLLLLEQNSTVGALRIGGTTAATALTNSNFNNNTTLYGVYIYITA